MDPSSAGGGSDLVIEGRRRRKSAWSRHKLGFVGLGLVGLIAFCALLGPLIIDIDPNAQNLRDRLLPPMAEGAERVHYLGTDALGRDMLARVVNGARASMGVVLAALVLGSVIGVVLGSMAGFYGGWLDNVVMRLVDAQLALPTLIAAMFVSAVLGTGFFNTALTLGIASWPIYARLIRAEVLRIREEDFIDAAVALGSSDRWLLTRHVAPNIVSAYCVVASLELGRTVLLESSLSFLGFGMQPPDPSWGSMIRQGQAYIFNGWWLSAIPGVFIMATVLGLNLLGDWLRDVLDPHKE